MCCLFGLIDYGQNFTAKEKSKMLSRLAVECQVRGTDATGIAYNHGDRLSIFKRPLPAHRMKLRIPRDCHVVMGHTRLTTQGSEQFNPNNHPFRGKADKPFALAHNGVLYNDGMIRSKEKLPLTAIETDSYVAVQLLERQGNLAQESLIHMAEQLEGTFVFTLLDAEDTLTVVRGDNPFCLYHFPKAGFYLYASTEEILKRAIQKMKLPREQPTLIPLAEGDILQIHRDGTQSQDRKSVC